MQILIDKYFDKLKKALDNLDREEIKNFINLLEETRLKGKTIYIMGNGGSASTASHFACDIAKGVSYEKHKTGKKFKIISLSNNLSTMLAYANDLSYDDIFVEQLKNLVEEDDLVIGISGSGNSQNVLKAIDFANKSRALTFGITGFDGGQLKGLAQNSINVEINDMQIAEDIHLVLTHLTMQILNNEVKC